MLVPNAMTSDAELPSIVRFSRTMEVVLTIALALIPFTLALVAFLFSEQLARSTALTGISAVSGPLSFTWSLVAFLVLLAASAPLMYAANAARLMFAGFCRGEVFTPLTATRIKQIALGLLAQAFVTPLAGLALSWVLRSAGKADGLALSITSSDLWVAVFAFIFLGIARVMRAAALLAEDNAAIV
ncbi:MAG: hypothetical protein QNJ62_14125 [Methyloceanibacter sp.]|nr:hypothetical protein [Methyloceanibacter sp.]